MGGPASRHLPYFLVLDAVRAPGCAVCRRSEEAVEDSLRHILHELITDGRFRDRLLAAGGFCREHSWRLAARHDVLGTSILLRDQVARFREEAAGRGRERKPSARCPVCETREETEAAALSVLCEHLGEPELDEALAASDGLCLGHFRSALERLRGRGRQAEALARLQQASLARLLDHLDELIRKQDHRFRQEPVGAEAGAWARAVSAIAGVDLAGLPRPRSRSLPPQKRAPGASDAGASEK